MEVSFDWTLIQSFLAVAETGSLSAAARRLRQSQPTLGRHVKALEAALKAELFHRVPKGLALTATGTALLPQARAMAEAAARLALTAEGQDHGLAGAVRITASEVVSHFLLPPVVARLRRDMPEVRIDLLPSDTTENLLFRDADIALRMVQPQQQDLIARRLPDLPLGLYAATGYLDRVGRPATIEAGLRLDMIGMDRSLLMIEAMRKMGLPVTRDSFAVRTDAQPLTWHLIRAGCGIGVVPVAVGQTDATVERLFPDLALPDLPMWIVAPEALRTTLRIRRVWDAVVAAFS